MGVDVWVLGSTGRSGRAAASLLVSAGTPVVLVGRDRQRLTSLAHALSPTAGGPVPTVLAGDLEEVLAQLPGRAPAVVVNTVGPFASTAGQVARACPPGTHYVDIGNELPGLQAVLDLHEDAVRREQVLVAGAAFGVLGTESVLRALCAGRPTPRRVRVDAIASVATEEGRIGPALAGSILGGAGKGGGRVAGGRLTRSAVGAEPLRLTTPDGEQVTTGSVPTGELLAAWRASGAPSVVAASSVVPTGTVVRAVVPPVLALLRVPAVRRFAVDRLAARPLAAAPMPRPHSFAHASVEWEGGERREGWLRLGDAGVFTAAVAAEVALRLVRGEGAPGAWTPGALFGPELAVAAGGELLL